MKVYGRNYAYGIMVELCVARNNQRRSALRYKGLAKVTSRRARKGFMLKFNPDTHLSAAFYNGLNHVQYQDGTNIVNINRDDAAGFRLDTMAMHRLHRNPVVKGSETLTILIQIMLILIHQFYKPPPTILQQQTQLQRCVPE